MYSCVASGLPRELPLQLPSLLEMIKELQKASGSYGNLSPFYLQGDTS